METNHKWKPAPNPEVPALTQHALFTGVSAAKVILRCQRLATGTTVDMLQVFSTVTNIHRGHREAWLLTGDLHLLHLGALCMQIQGQPVDSTWHWRGRDSQWPHDMTATWGQQPTRAGDQDYLKLASVGSFLLSRLGTCLCSLSAQQKPDQVYKVSEVVGSDGECVFSAVLWPLADCVYVHKLPT